MSTSRTHDEMAEDGYRPEDDGAELLAKDFMQSLSLLR